MNKLLTQKNDSEFKKNSADFYTLTVYSKEILGYDKFRLQEYLYFIKWKSAKLLPSKDEKFADSLKNFIINEKFKILTFCAISSYFVVRYRSLIVVPIFYFSFYCGKKFINKFNGEDVDQECLCFFCKKNSEKQMTLQRYNNYFKAVDIAFERNPSIRSWTDFEKEIQKSLK